MGITRIVFTTVFLVIASFYGIGQNVVMHKIVQGNTVYELAKEYDSTVDRIYEANPNLQERSLVIGETLKIPIFKKESIDSSQYLFHLVRSFESVYSISTKYELKDSTIFWHNKNLKGNPVLMKGQIIKVPKDPDGWKKKSGDFITLVPNRKPKYEVYIVKKKDTPEGLQKQWGIQSLDEFYVLNPDARESWFKGMAIVKPISVDVAQYGFNIKERGELDSSNLTNDSFNIACVLPFFIDQYIHQGPGKKRSQLAFSYRQGIEYAISSFMEYSDAKCEIAFYDSMNQRDTVSKAIDAINTINPHLILGPMYSSRLLEFSMSPLENRTVNLISKQASIQNTNVWNNIVSEDEFWLSIRQYYNQSSDDQLYGNQNTPRQLLVAGLNYGSSKRATKLILDGLESAEFLLFEGDDSWSQNEELTRLDSTVLYELVITENDPAFILDVLRNLRSVNVDFHWLTHEYQALENGLVSNNFARERVTLFTSNYTDYNNEDVLEFVSGFRQRFNREPDSYAMEAYDNTMYHLLRLFDGRSKWRGVRKGFDFGEGGEKSNLYVESRQFRNLRWEL
jgi:LysM repeat protein